MHRAIGKDHDTHEIDITAPATDAAREWQGWGTALKPANEPIVLARKPLIGTVAANVQAHGTGALNIDGCRVAAPPGDRDDYGLNGCPAGGFTGETYGDWDAARTPYARPAEGRWPANVIHDGSPEVMAAFAVSGGARSAGQYNKQAKEGAPFGSSAYGEDVDGVVTPTYSDTGSAARFFYTAKADKGDRLGSKHPTVKPVDLIAYLCRLVTPPGGTVLDPFAGSGTTAMACLREGFGCVVIEREVEYIADIKARLAHVEGADTPLFGATA